MANGWTPERRARQAEMISSWRPWERSTGPRTEDGKARSSQNRFQGARREAQRELLRQLNGAMDAHLELLDRLQPR